MGTTPSSEFEYFLGIVCGVPGTGKSAVSNLIQDRTDCAVHRTDVIRKDLFEQPTYSDAENKAVYEALFERARQALENGESAVLDATFCEGQSRDRTEGLATEYGAKLVIIRVTCEEGIRNKRIRERTDTASDADVEVAERISDSFEPINRPHAVIDNSDHFDRTQQQLTSTLDIINS